MEARRTLPMAALAAALAGVVLCSCAAPATPRVSSALVQAPVRPATIETFQAVNHLTWGTNTAAVEQVQGSGLDRYLNQQLHPRAAQLPPSVQAQIDAMTISQRPLLELASEMEQRRKDVQPWPTTTRKKRRCRPGSRK